MSEGLEGGLQDDKYNQLAESGIILKAGVNKFPLSITVIGKLSAAPELYLSVEQPDGAIKLLTVGLDKVVSPQLTQRANKLNKELEEAFREMSAL